jgi:putative phosphoribosyl transferase
MHRSFRSRREAGQALATKLGMYARRSDVVVLGLPRGGVPVAYEIAQALGASMDVFLVRKLGVPGHDELAMGAIASGGVRVLNDEVIQNYGISPAVFAGVARREQDELARRERLYRGDRPLPPLAARVAILVDDGLATGSSMGAAVEAVRRLAPARIVIAVPVGAWETCEEFRARVDEVVCLVTPHPFVAVGAWYDDFSQTSDDEVRELLSRAAAKSFSGADAFAY